MRQESSRPTPNSKQPKALEISQQAVLKHCYARTWESTCDTHEHRRSGRGDGRKSGKDHHDVSRVEPTAPGFTAISTTKTNMQAQFLL